MSYTLKVLSNAEFDRLPYKHAKEALGCADAKAGVAYVRRTGIKPLDSYVTDHELEELVAKVSPHEEDGIRYKKWGRVIAPILAGALTGGLGFGGLAAGMAGAGAGAGMARRGGARGADIFTQGALPGAVSGFGGGSIASGAASGFQGAAPGFLSKLGGTVEGAFGIGTGGAKGTTPSAIGGPAAGGAFGAGSVGPGALGFGAGVQAGTQPFQFPGTIPGATTTSQAALPAGQTGISGAGTTSGGTGPLTTGTEAGGGGNKLLEGLQKVLKGDKSNILGNIGRLGGSQLLGQAGPKADPFQPFQDSTLVQDVLNRVRQGATADMGPEQREAMSFEFDQGKEEALQAMKERFKALRPGSDVSNDSQLRELLSEIDADFEERKARALAGAQIGLGQSQTEQLAQLAQLDVFTLAQQAQISRDEAAQFQQMVAQLLGITVGGGNQEQTSGSVGGLFGGG